MKRLLLTFIGIHIGLVCRLIAHPTTHISPATKNAVAASQDNLSEQVVTADTLLKSLGNELKNPEYIEELLPSNFSYLMQLLHYGKKAHQSRDYVQSVLRLFNNLVKGTEWINSYAFCQQVLAHMPTYLNEHFIPYKSQSHLTQKLAFDLEMAERLQSSMNSLLFTSLSSKYEYFKKEPEKFLDSISFQLAELAQEELSIEQLRQTLVRFLDTCLAKLVWAPKDALKTWDSVKEISTHLTSLAEKNMLTNLDDLDDLFWTLTHRYCYFLNLASTDLPVDFYEAIKKDVVRAQSPLLQLEEQEDFIESKHEKLLRTVVSNQAKRMAFTQKGIVTS